MTHKNTCFGILVMTLVFGIMVVGCGNKDNRIELSDNGLEIPILFQNTTWRNTGEEFSSTIILKTTSANYFLDIERTTDITDYILMEFDLVEIVPAPIHTNLLGTNVSQIIFIFNDPHPKPYFEQLMGFSIFVKDDGSALSLSGLGGEPFYVNLFKEQNWVKQ